jgi:hypothetical protein
MSPSPAKTSLRSELNHLCQVCKYYAYLPNSLSQLAGYRTAPVPETIGCKRVPCLVMVVIRRPYFTRLRAGGSGRVGVAAIFVLFHGHLRAFWNVHRAVLLGEALIISRIRNRYQTSWDFPDQLVA